MISGLAPGSEKAVSCVAERCSPCPVPRAGSVQGSFRLKETESGKLLHPACHPSASLKLAGRWPHHLPKFL